MPDADLTTAIAAEIRRRITRSSDQPSPDAIDAAALRFHVAAVIGTDLSVTARAYADLADRDPKAACRAVVTAVARIKTTTQRAAQ